MRHVFFFPLSHPPYRRVKHIMAKLGATKADMLDELDDQDEADAVGFDLSWMDD